MNVRELAALLFEFADLLELIAGPEAGRAAAYRRAAIALRERARAGGEPIETLAGAHRLTEVPHVGPVLARKIEEYLATGRIEALDRLRAQVPPGVAGVLAVPGIGARTVGALWRALGIGSVDELEAAARAGRLRGVAGFGPGRERRVLAGIEQLRRTERGVLLSQALALAAPLERATGALVAGEARRGCPLVRVLDLVAPAGSEPPDAGLFAGAPEPTDEGWRGTLEGGLPVRCRLAPPERLGLAWLQATGSESHLAALGPLPPDGDDEEAVYAALGLPFIPPELREGEGEVEAARAGTLPRLLEIRDVRGDLHAHTQWSDGYGTPAGMAAAARERGYEYLAITDHSVSLHVAHGLDADRLRAQRREIDALNGGLTGFRILQGAEVEVLADGSLDFPDDVLAGLDFVIASVHSRFSQDGPTLTARALRALSHPQVHLLAHPLGRRLGVREPYPIDLAPLIRLAAERGKAVEVNGSPERLDLDGRGARLARAGGAGLCVDTDAHSPEGLAAMALAVTTARRGWLAAGDVWNTLPLPELLRRLNRGG